MRVNHQSLPNPLVILADQALEIIAPGISLRSSTIASSNWARLGTDGGLAVGAQLREQALEAQPPEVARDVRRIRNDVPVVLELDAVGSVVVPMRTLKTAR